MSKKIMKRSLVLGALMAFVITGSAMAEDDATNQNVIFSGLEYVNGEYNYLIFGGKSDDGDAKENTVIINDDAHFKNFIIGGSGNKAENNTVEINNGVFTKYISGGTLYKQNDLISSGKGESANKNKVEINNGKFNGGDPTTIVTGGYGKESSFNTVIVNGGEFNDFNVVGGGGFNCIKANDNVVLINGGKFKNSTIVGGYILSGEADGNTVNISGATDVSEADLYGNLLGEGTGNTLNITGWKGSELEAEKGYGTIGSAQNFNTINMFKGSKVTFGNPLNDANVAVNVKGATWNVDKTNTVGSASFDKDSVLVLKGDGTQFTEEGEYALNGNSKGTLSVEQGAKLTVEGIAQNTYNVATGFETISENKWQVTDLNTLMEGKWLEDENKNLQLQVTAKKAEDLAEDMGVTVNIANTMTDIITAANENKNIEPGTPEANVVDFANELANVAPEVAGQAVEAVVKMAEAGGNSATAASIVKNVTGVTNDRLSFNCGHSAPHKGGHGVGLFEEGSGADIWVEYVHGKDEVENMKSTAGATSYEGQYNGFVMGVDFKKVGKFQSGIAFNYGEGDTNSVGTSSRTHSDYDFWGVGYYGNIHNDDSNIIFDINYAQTDSDVINYNTAAGIVEASPETTTWTAGVKVEKLYQNENVQIVPYTGLRYMSIDPNDYKTKGASYSYDMERQDIWLLPLGVSIRQEIENDNGWTVSPRVDLSYIWAFGDTDSNMGFGHALDNKVTNIGYDVMDDGSFLGLVGIEAHKGQWGYGIAYSYQKGDHSESKKWYVDVNYSF